MGANHDILADKAGRAIISKIVNRENGWKQIFSNSIRKAGDFSWPRPDYVCFDHELKQSIAFEFKPPNHSKREYLTGLGQTLSYLNKHHYSGIILPKEIEGFKLAEYIASILSLDIFTSNFISVVGYDEKNLESNPTDSIELIKSIDHERTGEISFSAENTKKTYWCWWRDMSISEVFIILDLLDKHSNYKGDIYSNHVWDVFWDMLINGKTTDWEGNPRKKQDSPTSKTSEKQNYKIPLSQLDLIEPSEGRLSIEGYKLLSIGKIYGHKSKIFLDYLTKLVLTKGKHLILIQDLEEFKTSTSPESFSNQNKFRVDFENYLDKNNSIGPRKEKRKTTGNKLSYIRDEFKLWNKLSLLKNRTSKQRYFIPGRGVEPNWARITEIISKDFNF